MSAPAAPAPGEAASARVLDGTAVAKAVRGELAARVAARLASRPRARAPGLAVVLVGDRPDSATYVRMKKRACAEVGIADLGVDLPGSASTADVVAALRALNADARVDGILVQLPLPAGVDEAAVLAEISVDKDADGLHPLNAGRLAQAGRGPAPRALPCTPAGVLELLRRGGVPLEGATALVLGRSNIVGVPVAALLQLANATVTVAHSRTRDIPALCARADVVVAAIGRPEFVRGEWLKPGATLVDVGINAVPDASKASGSRLVGDAHYASCAAALGPAGAITPVPGGVGPMTIAMLLRNTVEAWERGPGGGGGGEEGGAAGAGGGAGAAAAGPGTAAA